MFGTIGPTELVIILVIALVIFGRRLPEVGRSLGRGIVEFKKGLRGIHDDIEDATIIDDEKKNLPPKENKENNPNPSEPLIEKEKDNANQFGL